MLCSHTDGPAPLQLANERGIFGFGQASDRAQTAAAGFDVHLVKPVELDVLLKVIAEG